MTSYTVTMDTFYATKLAKLKQLEALLDRALKACGELESHESKAPGGEEGYMFSTFATLSEVHADVVTEVDAVHALVDMQNV